LTSDIPSAVTDAVNAAKEADIAIFAGGIGQSIEMEGLDRTTITWPDNQLSLIQQLQSVSKSFVILQFGGGQVDSTPFKDNSTVNAILWAGYPGQSGGAAVFDILTGKVAPAGRLPITQYPANYVNEIPMTDMNVRPSSTSPGRTYKWFTGTPVFPFGFGLHYTTFSFSWAAKPASSFNIQTIVQNAQRSQVAHMDLAPFETFTINIKNTGKVTSDYVSLLFVNTTAGPGPFPNKELVSYTRLASVAPGSSSQAQLPVSIGSIARTDTEGDLWLYPGTYHLSLDTSGVLGATFTLQGSAAQITTWPRNDTTS